MTVKSGQVMDGVEKAVPTRFAIRFEVKDRVEKPIGDFVGQSVLYGFVKPFRGFAEWELDVLLFPGAGSKRADNLPIGVIKSGAHVLDGVGRNLGCFRDNGFVLFGENGTLAGLSVCFDDAQEGALFAKKLVKSPVENYY